MLIPPAPLVKVTSAENVVSSSTCPQLVQHLRGHHLVFRQASATAVICQRSYTLNKLQVGEQAHEKPLASSTSTSTSCLQLLQNTIL